MAEPTNLTYLIAVAIGTVLMLLGFYSLKALQPPMPVRIGLGLALLGAGLFGVAFMPGLSAVMASPVQFGLVIFCVGLGINQLAAPLRQALGRSV